MQDIVNDFLVLSQCSHASRMGIFDIRDCVEQAYAGMADYPGSRGVVFTLPDDTPMPLLYGNHKLIIRCIINLLTNAVKYIITTIAGWDSVNNSAAGITGRTEETASDYG